MPLPRFTHGRTGLEITRFGIGGAYCKDSALYRAALDAGVNYIDTARSCVYMYMYSVCEDSAHLTTPIHAAPRHSNTCMAHVKCPRQVPRWRG